MQPVMSAHTPTAARSAEASSAGRPPRAAVTAAAPPQSASPSATTVSAYPISGAPISMSRGSSGLRRLVAAERLQELLVAGLGGVVRRLVLLGVLGEDGRRLEVAVAAPRALDHGAAPVGEEIGRGAFVAHGHRGLP